MSLSTLGEYIAANKSRIIGRWKAQVIERLAIDLEDSELINDLPHFIDDIVTALNQTIPAWPVIASAQSHGRHRMRSGTDMASLVSEMLLITEIVLEEAHADELGLSSEEIIGLSRAVGRGASASANAYTVVRDQEIASQAQQHFSFVAHELRTPLQTAQLAVQVLAQKLEGQHGRYVSSLERALFQVLHLVDNSLVKVRLSGRPEVDLRQVSAQAVIRAVCEQLRDHVEDKGLQLVTDVNDFQLEADEKLLVSAVTNLVRNGVKFTPSGGGIRIRASTQADRAVFEVEDECGGMSDDVPAKLFHPFVQASADKTGHGLGLVIVKQAAEAHGGSVHVNNRPPHGCTFVLTLPLRTSGPPKAGA